MILTANHNAKFAATSLADQWWRLNNLYFITNENGQKVRFRCNPAQKKFFNRRWYLNIILKARQLGFSTFIQIFILDQCIFKQNIRAGVIAHTRDDAENIFSDKIKFAYDNLPEQIKAEVSTVGDSVSKLSLSNGSSIRVGTSLRSGTLQYLHVSELGKIARKHPDKAKEIKTGALNTVHTGNYIFIESTAEGPSGLFHDICQDSIKIKEEGRRLMKSEFKFHFFPWFDDFRYVLNDESIKYTEIETDYFYDLEHEENIILSAKQKNWYVLKWRQQKLGGEDNMSQEYPSTPEEVFDVRMDCSFFSPESIDACFTAKLDEEETFINIDEYKPDGFVIN